MHSLFCFAHHLCRCTWLLRTGHGEQYTSVKPKPHAGHTAGQPHHPYNRNSHHVSPHPSITKQVSAFTADSFPCVSWLCRYFGSSVPLVDLTLCFLLLLFKQRNVANEQKHAESLSGRSGNRNERSDQQHEQLRSGQPQPQLAQYHLHAQTTTSAAALYNKQVKVFFHACFKKKNWIFAQKKRVLKLTFVFNPQHVWIWNEP